MELKGMKRAGVAQITATASRPTLSRLEVQDSESFLVNCRTTSPRLFQSVDMNRGRLMCLRQRLSEFAGSGFGVAT